MDVPTFVDLQGFIINKRFIVKEAAVLKNGSVLCHYIFKSPVPWHELTRSEKSQASWVIRNHHGLRWEDGVVPYDMAQRLITSSIKGATENGVYPIVYVKGLEKREWLLDIVDYAARLDLIIETLDMDYGNVVALKKLDAANTMLCRNHVKNCALQNVFKIFNWWLNYQSSK